MDGGTLAVLGAILGAVLLGVGALVRHRAAARRRLAGPRGEDGATPSRPARSPAKQAQGAAPDAEAARREEGG